MQNNSNTKYIIGYYENTHIALLWLNKDLVAAFKKVLFRNAHLVVYWRKSNAQTTENEHAHLKPTT